MTSITNLSNEFVSKIYHSGYWSVFCFWTLTLICQFNGSFVLYSSAFTAADMDFVCVVDNNSLIYRNKSCKVWINKKYTDCPNNQFQFQMKPNYVHSSIISDFVLVCQRKYLDEILQSLIIFGLVLGGFIGPILGDKFGRLIICFISLFSTGVIGVSLAFVNNFYIFAIGKLLIGFFREISTSNSLVLAMEHIPSDKQTNFGMFSHMTTCTLIGSIGILAYFIRDWKTLQITGSIPAILSPLLLFIVYESPRWIITKKNVIKFQRLIKCYVEFYNKLDENYFNKYLHEIQTNDSEFNRVNSTKNTMKNRKFCDSIYLKIWTVIIILSWIQIITTIMSLNFIATLIPGSPYFNFFLSGCIDSMGIIIAFGLLGKSRNMTISILENVAAVCFIVSTLLPKNYEITLRCMLMISKSCAAGIAYVLYVTSLYIYPSSIRITGANATCAIGKFFAIFSPYFVHLYTLNHSTASIILCVYAVLTGFMNLWYPEWVNKSFPETMDDVENLKEHNFLLKRLTKNKLHGNSEIEINLQ